MDDGRQTADDNAAKPNSLTTASEIPGGEPRATATPAAVGRRRSAVVAVVGPCASGKSTLTAALRAAGYEARQPAQEHSYVADMWRRLVDPDVLIYLDISYEALLERRPHFGEREYLERQKARLAHARAHADLVVDTSELAAEEVRRRVLAALGVAAGDAT